MDVNTRDISRKRFLVLVSFFELFNFLYLVVFKIPKPAVWVLLISNIFILCCVCVLAFSGALKKNGMNRYLTLLCRYNALIYSIAGGKGVGLVFKKGEVIRKVNEDELVSALMEEIEKA